jgi:uncharacterized protein YraI
MPLSKKVIMLCSFWGLMALVIVVATPRVSADDKPALWLEVIDPYVEMHSGPGRGYPVFYVIEQGEQVDVITRRPGWYEVRTKDGKQGWTNTAQISRTVQTTGEPADLPTVSYGDYLKNSLRVGFNAGKMSGDQLESSEFFTFTAGYRPFSWGGFEIEAGRIFGLDVKGKLYGINLLIEPLTQWRVSPVLILGTGTMELKSQPKVQLLGIDDPKYNQYGLGLNYYLGRNFVAKAEYRSLSVSFNKEDVSLKAWTIGFNTFF